MPRRTEPSPHLPFRDLFRREVPRLGAPDFLGWAVADCPYCGTAGSFRVNLRTGRWVCLPPALPQEVGSQDQLSIPVFSAPTNRAAMSRTSRPKPANLVRQRRLLHLLLSPLYEGALAPEHRADLVQSGLAPQALALHKLMSIPPSMIPALLGFGLDHLVSALLIPYPAPAGGWMPHIRVKCFPTLTHADGSTIKYLQPKGAIPRLFFRPMPLTRLPRGPPGGSPDGSVRCHGPTLPAGPGETPRGPTDGRVRGG
jgi:hypothetical protein